jgi:hypothetical protein
MIRAQYIAQLKEERSVEFDMKNYKKIVKSLKE